MSSEEDRKLVVGVSDASSTAPVESPSTADNLAKPVRSERRRVSLVGILVVVTLLVIIAVLVIFVFIPNGKKQSVEAAYEEALTGHVDDELMSTRLNEMIKLHYEKGNYESVRPYIEETAAAYEDGYAKVEALSTVNIIFYNAEDWSSLRLFYDYMYKLVKDCRLDEQTIKLFRDFAEEAREREEG